MKSRIFFTPDSAAAEVQITEVPEDTYQIDLFIEAARILDAEGWKYWTAEEIEHNEDGSFTVYAYYA